jgi:hypothetical protein
MENKERRGGQDHLEEHSLPGTNQAGKGPEPGEEADPAYIPGRGRRHDGALEEPHSLPGTNQAGKGPSSGEKND